MPLSCCSAARLTAPLTSSLLVARLATNLKSITETFGVGTRIDTPSSRPASSGRTRPTAFAAPVEVGIMFSAAGAIHIFMYLIERGLVIGVRVHRCHKPLVDTDCVIEHFHDRRQTICGT